MIPLNRPPLLTVSALLAAFLSSCGGLTPISAQVGGTIIYPPAAGEAVFSGLVGGSVRDFTRAAVAANGTYTLNLPANPPLPAYGNASSLTANLNTLPGEFSSVQCGGQSNVTNPYARVVMLSEGRYLIGGQVSGQLTPATGVVGGQLQPQESSVITVKSQVYSDRDVALKATLSCTYTRPDGTTQAGSTQVDYALVRGWNTLETQTVKSSTATALATTSTSHPLTDVDWRYTPTGN